LSLVLVDLPPLTALGARTVLSAVLDPARVEIVGDREDAIDRVRDHDVDLVIVDPRQPNLSDGLKFCKRLKDLRSPPYVLAFSWLKDNRDIMYCLLAGVDSFVSCDQPPDRLAAAVLSTVKGHREWILGQRGAGPAAGLDEVAELTPRERDVLWMLRERRTNQQIASALCISTNTVKNHVAAILRKLGMRRRSELFNGATGPIDAIGTWPV
jgi:DNA-binding NarL/FixJ family response regulator